MAQLRLTQEYVLQAAQSAGVRKGLRDKAAEVQRHADRLAGADNVDANFWLEDGTRPGGRPYANVVTDAVGQEYGDGVTGRRRILGRAAEQA